MGSVLTGLLVEIASLISGGIGGAIGTITSLITAGSRQLLKFHVEGVAFARDMGMSLEQAQAYTATLTKNTAELAQKYGVTAEQIKAVQRNLSEATNRQLMLNRSQVDGFVALNKLVGDATVSKFAEEMMTGMGAQVSTVEGAISKAYITSAKNGLNAKKVSADIANNLSMMNKLSFRNGVDGLTKMAVQAQKVGMSLSQVEGVARTFMDFDQSIEHAAQLQMLGGAAGAMGGNPLDMMYEANYDPEALQDRMIKMMSGYATFDAKTGMSKINGMGMDFIRNIAKAMGMDEGEAVKVAKKNAEIQYKTEKLGGMQGLTEDQKSAVINKSYVENGRVYVTDKNDNKVDITGGNIPPELVNFLSEYEGMDELDIMKEQAKSLTDINANIKGFWESAKATFAEHFNKFLPDIQRFVKEVGPVFVKQVAPVAKNLSERLGTFFKNGGIDTMIEIGKNVIKAVGKISEFFTSSWPKLIAAILAAKMLGGGKILGRNLRTGAGALKSIKKFKKGDGFWDMMLGRAPKMHKGKNGLYYSKGRQGAWSKDYSKYAKYGRAAKIGTGAFGVALAGVDAYNAFNDYGTRKKEIMSSSMSAEEKNKALEEARIDKNTAVGGAVGEGVGTLLGTFFFGPLGAMIGGAVGKFAGEFIGKYWDPIVNTVTSLFKKVGDGLVWLGGKLWDSIKWLADNNPVGLMVKGIGKIVGKDWSITGAIGSLFGGGEKHANGGIVGGNGGVDSTPAMLTPGEMVLTKEQQGKLFNAINNIFGIPQRTSNFVTNNNSNSRHSVNTRNVGISNIGGNRNATSLYNSTSRTRNVGISNIGGDRNTTNYYNSTSHIKNPGMTTGLEMDRIRSMMRGYQVTPIKGVNPVATKIEAKPVGQKEYINTRGYHQQNSQPVNGNVKVNDFNINIGGTLRLDGGNSSKNLDIKELLKDPQFVNALKDTITNAISSSYNGGRHMNDIATMRGLTTQTTTFGR